MLDIIQKFFKPAPDEQKNKEHQAATHDVNIATCALLLEIANIDGEFTELEQKKCRDKSRYVRVKNSNQRF